MASEDTKGLVVNHMLQVRYFVALATELPRNDDEFVHSDKAMDTSSTRSVSVGRTKAPKTSWRHAKMLRRRRIFLDSANVSMMLYSAIGSIPIISAMDVNQLRGLLGLVPHSGASTTILTTIMHRHLHRMSPGYAWLYVFNLVVGMMIQD